MPRLTRHRSVTVAVVAGTAFTIIRLAAVGEVRQRPAKKGDEPMNR
jgi:hypothetical protein